MLQPKRRKYRKEQKGRNKGLATRGSFLIDAEGTVVWSVVNPTGQAREQGWQFQQAVSHQRQRQR